MTSLLMASTPCSGLSSRPIIQHSCKVKHKGIANQRDKVLLSERGKGFTSSFCVPSPKGLWTISRGEILLTPALSHRISRNRHCHLASMPLMAEETTSHKTSNILQLQKAGILLLPSPIWNAFKSNVFCWVPAGICNLSPYKKYWHPPLKKLI